MPEPDFEKPNLNIQFDTPNGVALNKLDDDIIAALMGAGLTRISIAIESGSEYIRNKVIKKGLSTEKIYENTSILASYDELFINAFLKDICGKFLSDKSKAGITFERIFFELGPQILTVA